MLSHQNWALDGPLRNICGLSIMNLYLLSWQMPFDSAEWSLMHHLQNPIRSRIKLQIQSWETEFFMVICDDSEQIILFPAWGKGSLVTKQDKKKSLATKTQRCPSSKVKCYEANGEEILSTKIMFISIFISYSVVIIIMAVLS